MKYNLINTPIGEIIAVSDENNLRILAFSDQKGLENKLSNLLLKKALTKPIESIRHELNEYFLGNLKNFKTPYIFLGTDFQKIVWHELSLIKYGQIKSYHEQAKALGKPLAYRAVANANSQNPLAIIIPCHRVIRSNGDLGGYRGGLNRKDWLLKHEKKLNT